MAYIECNIKYDYGVFMNEEMSRKFTETLSNHNDALDNIKLYMIQISSVISEMNNAIADVGRMYEKISERLDFLEEKSNPSDICASTRRVN